jgi:hypothetical protein
MLGEICHDRNALLLKKGIVAVRFAAVVTDRVGDCTQDHAGHIVAFSHPGDRPGFPIRNQGSVFGDQHGDITRHKVPISGDHGPDHNGLGRGFWQPGEIQVDAVTGNRCLGIRHLFVNIVNHRPMGKDHIPTRHLSPETAAGAQVNQPVRQPAVNGVLGGTGGSDLAPTTPDEADSLPGETGSETLTIGRGLYDRMRVMGHESPPFRAGGDQDADIHLFTEHSLTPATQRRHVTYKDLGRVEGHQPVRGIIIESPDRTDPAAD